MNYIRVWVTHEMFSVKYRDIGADICIIINGYYLLTINVTYYDYIYCIISFWVYMLNVITGSYRYLLLILVAQ